MARKRRGKAQEDKPKAVEAAPLPLRRPPPPSPETVRNIRPPRPGEVGWKDPAKGDPSGSIDMMKV